MSKKVKFIPEWFKNLTNFYSEKKRVARKNKTLAHISKFNDGVNIDEEGEELKRYLKEDCEFIGFIPNVCYAKDRGTKQDLESMFVHHFGQVTLLYKVKKLPAMIIVNNSIKLDDSVIRILKGNEGIIEKGTVQGITS
jgi:hypothetical protein